jgi:hypothetical protein
MTGAQTMNPFHIGERVTFAPDVRTAGWAWSSFDRLRLQPGDTGTVTRIDQGYICTSTTTVEASAGSASRRQPDRQVVPFRPC